MRSPRSCASAWMLIRLLIAALLLGTAAGPAVGQAPSPAADEEAARQQQIISRFLTVLERNPRRGTALDKIYGFHIENGTLDALVKEFTDRTAKDPKDGTAWMILGLVEAQRGRDGAAVGAFTEARQLRGEDP